MDSGPDESNSTFLLGLIVISLEILSIGAHVHEENGTVQGTGGMFFSNHGLLDGRHAADRGTVSVITPVNVSGTYALEPGNLPRILFIRRPLEMACVRACGAQNSLEFKARDHVGILSIVIGFIPGGIKGSKPRRKNHGACLNRDFLLLVVEVYRTGGTKLLTGAAFPFLKIDAMVFIDDILERHGLGVLHINGFSLHEAFVVFAIHFLRAFFSAGAAGNALLHVYISGAFENLYLKVPLCTADIQNLREGEDLDVKMPADLDQFRGNDSHGAVIGGEGLVQLRHDPADRGRLLHEVHEIARIGKV
jgi:hypothetical protein